MKLFDTHAHFESADRAAAAPILERAAAAGVARICAIGGDPALNAAAAAAAQNFPAACITALGFDRDQATLRPPHQAIAALCQLIAESHPAAIGEIGLDFHYAPQTAAAQCELFAAQLALADELALPVSIHTRDADDATLQILKDVPWHHSALRGIIHCFTGAPQFAGRLLDCGFMVSFSGIATFKSAETVRAAAAYVPADRLLIETDSPFLAPVPLRGQKNEPANLAHTARFIAALRGVAPETLAALTFANAEEIFAALAR